MSFRTILLALIIGSAIPSGSDAAQRWPDSDRCTPVLREGKARQSTCHKRKNCDQYANSGKTPNLSRYRACMAACADEGSSEYRYCYYSLAEFGRELFE
jgi:hypothetical protein